MNRKRVLFWLNTDKADEDYIASVIDELKRGRVFMRAIREGLAIVYDLMNGRLDALLHYYPWVADEIRKMSGGDDDKERLARIEQLLLYNTIEQGGNGMLMQQSRTPIRELPPKPTTDNRTVIADEDSSQNLLDAFL